MHPAIKWHSHCVQDTSQHLTKKPLSEVGPITILILQRNLHKWAQVPSPGKLLVTLQNPARALLSRSPCSVHHYSLHDLESHLPCLLVCTPCSETWFSESESLRSPCVWHRQGFKTCLPNGIMEAVTPLFLTPMGPPAGKGCLSPLTVTRRTSRACPPRGVWAALLPQLTPSLSFQEDGGGGYSEGVSIFQGWLQDAQGEAVGPEGGAGLSKRLIFPTVL